MLTRDIMTLIDQLEHLALYHREEEKRAKLAGEEGMFFHRDAASKIEAAVKVIKEGLGLRQRMGETAR